MVKILTIPSTGAPIVTPRELRHGNPSVVVNGDHSVRARGNGTFSTLSTYGIDQVRTEGVGSTYVGSAQAHALGASGVLRGMKEKGYFSRTIVTSVANAANCLFYQRRIEGVETFAGRWCTLSWIAKAGSALPMSCEVYQYFGSGGSPSSFIGGIGVKKVTLSTEWAMYFSTFFMPSVNTKVLGSNSDDYVGINLWFDAGANFNARTGSLGQQSGTFDVDMVKLEEGLDITPFIFNRFGKEEEITQRWYAPIPAGQMNGYMVAGTVGVITANTASRMRGTPTATPTTLTNMVYDPKVGLFTPSSQGVSQVGPAHVTISLNVTGATSGNWITSNVDIALSSEL